MAGGLLRLVVDAVAAVTVAIMLFNASLMLMSPRRWFALPGWLALHGTLGTRRSQYASGWGALQVRLLGGIIVATIIWVGYDLLRAYLRPG